MYVKSCYIEFFLFSNKFLLADDTRLMYMYKVYVQCKYISIYKVYFHRPTVVLCIHSHIFFSILVFFHVHSRFTGQLGKGKGIYLTPLNHFHPLHRHLDISRVITAGSSPLHISGSKTRTRNLLSPIASC